MRLSVSHIAWSAEEEPEALALLARLGISQLEVAPARIAPWAELDAARVRAYRAALAAQGLGVSSLQALYFGTGGLSLMEDAPAFDAFLAHTRRVAEIGAALGAPVGVFGAPGLKRRGALSEAEARARAVERLAQVAEAIADTGFTLALEPVPARYGADFLMRTEEILEVVAAVGHPAVGLHLDVSCVELGGGDIAAAIARAGADGIRHFHIAEPDLAGFAAPVAGHAAAAAALEGVGYDGTVAIEMRRPDADWACAVITAVEHARRVYGAT